MSANSRLWNPRDALPALEGSDRVRLFALRASRDFGKAVADALGVTLCEHEEREFEDGEHKARPLHPVRGADVYVVQSLHSGPDASANDKLCRLAFFVGALKDAGAARVTALVPYLCYARKDRRTKPSDPVTSRYVAQMIESVGTDCAVTLDVHNPAAFENAFRCQTVALTAAPLFVDYLARFKGEKLCVVSPDTGGAKRAELLREMLEDVLGHTVGKAFADKHRSAGIVSGDLFVGDAAGATAIIVDDLISSGGTLLRAARAARKAGAVQVLALVTHGLFMAGAPEVLEDPAIDRLVITDAVPPFRLPPGAAREKVDVLPAAPLFACALALMQGGRPLTELMVF
ncbi:MAG TPA: ribose-phosphate diphosphokinase [Hyphomicrobium sp.]|nr:ribose-phosphate diphosphokinase [Hyphomicrobium sp.]